MSDYKLSSPVSEEFQKKMLEESELLSKEALIKKTRIENQYKQVIHGIETTEKIKSIDFIAPNDLDISSIQEDYLREEDLGKVRRTFIRPEFKDVPHGPYQLILVGARSGEGKSTTAANLALGTIKDGKKVLLITNEETPYDSYNRVTALQNGWPFSKGANYTDEQKKIFFENMPVLSKQMKVIHENYGNGNGITTTIEGICGITGQMLDAYLKTGIYYDTVIFDYYQNIKSSNENPSLTEFQVQKLFYNHINQFKKKYPASFVVLAQVRAEKEDKNGNVIEFKERIEGTKEIYNAATCAIEMKSHKTDRMTEWLIRKHRWQSDLAQQRIVTGWDKGLYVEHNIEFIESVEKEKMNKLGIKP
jgi:hypothetical protein